MNFKLKDIVPQLITVLAVVLVFGFFTYNAQINMENRGIDFGYGFLSQESSFDVQFSLIEYDGSHSYFRAYLVGLLNTILVSVIGIIIATILGVIVGIARLSPNYLINKFAAFYVEFFRNIPLLLQIFFWYFAALRALPLPQDAEAMFGVFFLTIKGLYVPAFIWQNFNIFFYSIIAAIIAIIVIRAHAKKVQENQGKQIPVFFISLQRKAHRSLLHREKRLNRECALRFPWRKCLLLVELPLLFLHFRKLLKVTVNFLSIAASNTVFRP